MTNKICTLTLLLIFGFVVFACLSKEPGAITITPGLALSAGPDYVADWDHKDQGKDWTEMTSKALDDLGKDLLFMKAPTDYQKYCSRFDSLKLEERKQLFIMLISSMARFESGFKPETSYQEDFNDAQGRPVISRGLLQLSIESANGYGCGFRDPIDLHDPEANIRCAVRILSRWIPRDGCLGCKTSGYRGAGRYWSVMRPGKRQNQISAKVSSLQVCK